MASFWILFWYAKSGETTYSRIEPIKKWQKFATWMDLENIMLNEINQSEKVKNHMISRI